MKLPRTQYGVLDLPKLVRDIPMGQFLREQLIAGKGCPLCRAAEHEEFRLFASLIGDVINDSSHPLLQSDPLCNRHAVFFQRVGGPKSTAHLCRHLLRRQLALPVGEVIELTRRCPACELLRTRQEEWLGVLEVLLKAPLYSHAYAQGYGVCLPHYLPAMAQFTNEPVIGLLERSLRPQCERLIPQLDLVIEKGVFQVDRQVAASPERAREKLFGCAGLTDYLSLPDVEADSKSVEGAISSAR